jgi:hypothetical protein
MIESSALQKAARLVGIAFLVVGVLGFIPGITTHYDELKFADDTSGAQLLGIFQVSILHNVVHLLFGVAGLALSRTWEGSRNFLIGGGVAYLALWAIGIAGSMDWLPADDADDWLHLALGASMLLLGVVLRGRKPQRDAYAAGARA